MMSKKTFGNVGVLVAIVAIVALAGVVYAGYTQSLTIDGSASVEAANWKIEFVGDVTKLESSTATQVTAPQIKTGSTAIGDYAVKFTKPGQTISYTFKVKNNGDFDAKVGSVTVPTPTCTGSGETATADAAKVCDSNLEYTLVYNDSNNAVAVDDALASGEEKTLKLTLTYKDISDASDLPTNDVTISNLQVSINYVQD